MPIARLVAKIDTEPAGEASLGDKVWEALGHVLDPELHMSIVSLGLIYGVRVQDHDVDVDMTLTSPACPYGGYLVSTADHAARSVEGVGDVRLNLVWEPPWGPDKMSDEVKLDLGFDL